MFYKVVKQETIKTKWIAVESRHGKIRTKRISHHYQYFLTRSKKIYRRVISHSIFRKMILIIARMKNEYRI